MTSGNFLTSETERANSESSDPSSRMTGSIIWEDRGVRASGGSSVELDGDRTDGFNTGVGAELGGTRLRYETLLAAEAFEALRRRLAVAEERGLRGTG